MSKDSHLRTLAQTSAAIRAAEEQIRALSEKRRNSATAARAAGVTYKEMAEAMGLSEVTVYTVLRGRKGEPLRARK